MTLIVDAGPLVALGDIRDPKRVAVRAVLKAETGSLIIPAPVTAEVDYMLRRRVGAQAARAFLDDLAERRFTVEHLATHEYREVLSLDQQYNDLDLGLADASIVVLAHRFGTRRLLTFDYRHFHTVTPLDGGAFILLPEE